MKKKEFINYNEVLKELLLDMVKSAFVKAKSFENNYNFFIIIDTNVEGVKIPIFMKKSNPIEMNLYINVKQSNLEIKNKCFLLDIFFKEKIHKLSIPFKAIIHFSDKKEEISINLDNIEEFKDTLSDINYEEYETEIDEDFFYEIFNDLIRNTEKKQKKIKKIGLKKENDNLISFRDLLTKKGK